MTTTNTNVITKSARRKLNLLELANELSNVSKACKIMGYSRQQFYEIRRNYQTFGSEGLIDRVSGATNPTHGSVRVAQQLNLKGHRVSSGGVRGVWTRTKLLTKHQRLLRLDQHLKENPIELNENQIRLLERFNPEYRDRHIQADFTGDLVSMDTFMVGTLKGIGRVYLQTVIDCHSRYAWGTLHTSKMPITAVQTLNNEVLPFFEEHNIPIKTILTDNVTLPRYCGQWLRQQTPVRT